jgi:phage terminase large subunit-like protein
MAADPDADPDDREQWHKANPSFPHRTPLESMLRLRENLPSDEAWKREALGIWDAVQGHGVLPAPSWKSAEDETSIAVDRFALGIECGPDLAYASVALAGQRRTPTGTSSSTTTSTPAAPASPGWCRTSRRWSRPTRRCAR